MPANLIGFVAALKSLTFWDRATPASVVSMAWNYLTMHHFVFGAKS
jgi:hypothetical protein